MAKTVYVDGINGNNSNNGLSWATAKKTIVGARAATANGDLVLIAPGIYLEPTQSWNSANDDNVLYRPDVLRSGLVIVDFEHSINRQSGSGSGIWYYTGHWGVHRTVKFANILFRNPFPTNNVFILVGNSFAAFYHCVFYQKDGSPNTGAGFHGTNDNWNVYVENCSFWNLDRALFNVARKGSGRVFNNYINNVTTPIVNVNDRNYNAFSGNTAESFGIDTNSGNEPGFIDPENGDFRLDPLTKPDKYQMLLTSGIHGTRIGAFGKGGIYYNPSVSHLRYISADPTPAQGNTQLSWENEGPDGSNTYNKGTPGNVIEDSTTKELIIDIATTPGATGGRIRTDVFDLGSGITRLLSVAYGSYEDTSSGIAIDTDEYFPKEIEYRSSNTLFDKDDLSPSWIAIKRGDYLNIQHKYAQFRVELRTDHTNT